MSTQEIGILDGKSGDRFLNNAVAGFADIRAVDISGSSDEDIDLVALLSGTGYRAVVRGFKSTDSVAGNLLIKTLANGSAGYVSFPMQAGEHDNLLVEVTHIKKTGSISGVIAFYQKVQA